MTTLLGVHSLSKSFGSQILFTDLSFTLSQGDRVGLVGPNGAGKSTLMKIMRGLEKPDEGSISSRGGIRIGYASQLPEFPDLGLEEVLVQHGIGEEYELLTKARVLLGKAKFADFSQSAKKLSGGWKKRLDILAALMCDPDLLLLDEPTNHLDLEGILWLEKFLLREANAFLMISHDRTFLNNMSSKVIELNRTYPTGLFESSGNLDSFLINKEAFIEGQKEQERSLANSVRGEVDWLRRSPKARTCKSQSRVDRAHRLIEELAEVKGRNKVTKVDLEFVASDRDTRKLLVAKNLGKSMGGKPLFNGVDITLGPGTRLGIVGKNGTGKSTLLKVLAGTLTQDMGTLKYADDIQMVYFDQHREQITGNMTLRRALAPLSDMVIYRGQSIHVNGWAKKFLFHTDRLELPVSCLSGGERARLLIANLMLKPADILFLDEPTNDLDIPTLEVIEESLQDFAGAVVLITHDRSLMDNVATQILGLGVGNEQQFFADYQQWEKNSLLSTPVKKEKEAAPALSKSAPVKMNYKERLELDAMEKNIMAHEEAVEELKKKLEEIRSDKELVEGYQNLSNAQIALEKLFERWEYLSNKEKGLAI